MVKSIIQIHVEPGYEDTLLARLKKERQVIEAHLVNYENAILAFSDSKDEKQAEELARSLRAMRMVREVTHTYILNAVKSGFGRMPRGKHHLALIFGQLDPGTEESTLEALAAQKGARDVLAITGPFDVLITTTAKDIPDIWPATGGLLRNIRFLSGTETYMTLRSIAQD